MEGDRAKTETYRERAGQMRAIAEKINDPESQRVLRRIAAAYEHLAETVDPSIPKPWRNFG